MSEADIATAFAQHGPWITQFEFRGRRYGGNFDAPNDARLSIFREQFPRARRILELGALEGGHTLGLSRFPDVEFVLGLEGRRENYERALFVRQLFAADKISFALANLEQVSLGDFGKFDAIFCCGLLYHLPEPWRLIEQCSCVAPGLFLWTHCADELKAGAVENGYKGRRQKEGGAQDPLSGLSPDSFWPTLGSLCTMLTNHGFNKVHLLENNAAHPNGPAVIVAAFATIN